MKDDLELLEDITELEDFDLSQARYEVWVLEYNADPENPELLKDTCMCVRNTAEAAVEWANLLEIELYNNRDYLEEDRIYEIIVETVIEVEPNYSANVGTLFSAYVSKN